MPENPDEWKKIMNIINGATDACTNGFFSEKNFIELMLASNDTEVCMSSRENWLKSPGIKIERVCKQI